MIINKTEILYSQLVLTVMELHVLVEVFLGLERRPTRGTDIRTLSYITQNNLQIARYISI